MDTSFSNASRLDVVRSYLRQDAKNMRTQGLVGDAVADWRKDGRVGVRGGVQV